MTATTPGQSSCEFLAPIVKGNEAIMRIFGASGGASSGAPSRAGGGLLTGLRFAGIPLPSSILIGIFPQYNRY